MAVCLFSRRLVAFKLQKLICRRRTNRGYSVGSLVKEERVLGIETSCDDTGCAVVNNKGKILGECLNSQLRLHIQHGGILPPIAGELHKENIKGVVDNALERSGLNLLDLDAIAVTVKPGLAMSLLVGTNYAKMLSATSGKPLIPIHHMEAHALTVRMIDKVDFPFMVLLISGGHCLLAVAQDVDKFLLLGKSLDDAPGEAFDKIARRLKLYNMADFEGMSGGRAVELAAKRGDFSRYAVAEPLLQTRDCDFSFAGIKNSVRKIILDEEEKHDVLGDEMIPGVFDLCASVQLSITKHLARRLLRAIHYSTKINPLLPQRNATLVVSGGVASNTFIRQVLELICNQHEMHLVAPPSKLCTDNGAMIAWNGMERWLTRKGIIQSTDLHLVDIEPKCAFGEDMRELVKKANIKSLPMPSSKEINECSMEIAAN